MHKGDTSDELVDGVACHLSLPSLAVPDATKKVSPVPLPRNKPSTAQERECVNKEQRRTSCTSTSGLSVNLDAGAGVKAKSCQDIRSACATADPCLCENNNILNNIQISETDSSVTDGSVFTDCTPTADKAFSANGTVQYSVSDSVHPLKPPRSKRQVTKELPENTGSLDVDVEKISSMTVQKVESDNDKQTTTQQNKRSCPQPVPRKSLVTNSTALQTDKTDEKQSKELAVESDVQEVIQSMCPCGESENNIPGMMPICIAGGITEDEMGEKDGHSFDCQKLHDRGDDNVTSVKSEQIQLEVENDASSVKLNSKGLIPSRAAPPPPLPKPKVKMHSSGSFEVTEAADDGVGSKHVILSASGKSCDSFHSSLVTEIGSKTPSKSYIQQPVENSETRLSYSAPAQSLESNGTSSVFCLNSSSNVPASTSVPVALDSLAKVEPENQKLPSVEEGGTVKGPQSVVRGTKKSQHSCKISSEILSCADVCGSMVNEHGYKVSSVGSEQIQSEVKNDVSSVKQNSNVCVPSRAAPPPPLPKPKVKMHSSGSFEVTEAADDGVGSKHAILTDSGNAHDSFLSSSVTESSSTTLSKCYIEQPVENNETPLSDSAPSQSQNGSNGSSKFCLNTSSNVPASTCVPMPVVLDSLVKVEPDNQKLPSVQEGGTLKGPEPRARRMKKSIHSCKRKSEILRSSDVDDSHSDTRCIQSYAPATRRWSERIVHGKKINSLPRRSCSHLTPIGSTSSAHAPSIDSTCPSCEFGNISPKMMPMHIAGKVAMTEDEHKVGSVDSEQIQSEVESDVSSVKQNSNVCVPSGAAPPPPLPKPKVKMHSSGSFEVMKAAAEKAEPEKQTLSSIGDGSNVKGPVPAVRKSKNISQTLCRRTYEISSCASESNMTNAHSRVEAPRRRSEGVVRGDDSSDLQLLTSEAAGQSALKRIDSEDVSPENGSLCLIGEHHTAADVKRNSLPRENVSYLTEGGTVTADTPFDSTCCRTSCEINQYVVDTLDPTQHPSSHEMYVAGTPPITPAAFGFDAADEKERAKVIARMNRKAFLIAKEIVETEETFIQVLRMLNEDFRGAVDHATKSLGRPVVPDAVVNQIIRYLPQLQVINEDLLTDLKGRLDNWEADPRLADIFVKKGAFLKMYTDYIREYESMVSLLDDTRKRNPDFDKIVTDFESDPRCANLTLKHHYMLKPVQRIPQYRLLLQDYQKQLIAGSPDYENTQKALLIVSGVAEHANQSMKYLERVKRLQDIQNSLFGQFEVIKPGRVLIKDGELNKLSRKEMQPRMFFLFNDVLLYTAPVATGYKLNNVLPLAGMKVSVPRKEEYQNEFSIITTKRSFTISAKTEEEKLEWLRVLGDTIRDSVKRRSSFIVDKERTIMKVNIEMDMKEFKVGTIAPVWIPDGRVSMCTVCQEEFRLVFRRHHCRGCGKVVCGECSEFRAPLPYLGYRPDRVCLECFHTLKDAVEKIKDDEGEAGQRGSVSSQPRPVKEELMSLFKDSPRNRTKSKMKRAVLGEVCASADANKSGYLQLYRSHSWRKMWFVVKDRVLYTFKASEDAAAEESTPLPGYVVAPCTTSFSGIDASAVFELRHPGVPTLFFRAENQQACERWMSVIQQATSL